MPGILRKSRVSPQTFLHPEEISTYQERGDGNIGQWYSIALLSSKCCLSGSVQFNVGTETTGAEFEEATLDVVKDRLGFIDETLGIIGSKRSCCYGPGYEIDTTMRCTVPASNTKAGGSGGMRRSGSELDFGI